MYSSWCQRLEVIKQVAAAAQAGNLGADVTARQPIAPWRSTLDDAQWTPRCLLCESPAAAQACSVWLCHRIRSDLLCVWRRHAGRGKGRQTEYGPGLSPHASLRDTWPALTAKRCDAALNATPFCISGCHVSLLVGAKLKEGDLSFMQIQAICIKRVKLICNSTHSLCIVTKWKTSTQKEARSHTSTLVGPGLSGIFFRTFLSSTSRRVETSASAYWSPLV